MKRVLGKYQPIDLTHPLHPEIPTWTGGCGFQVDLKRDYSEGGVRVNSIKCHAGIGTHMDAPSHFTEGGWDIAEIPIENFIVPLQVLDIRKKMDPDLFIQPEDILEFEKTHGKVKEGSAFFANTGWSQFWKSPDKFRNPDREGGLHFPGFSIEAALLLLERGIVGIGIDTLSPDGSNTGNDSSAYPVHIAVLGAKKYIIENLYALEKVPPTGSFVVALPPKATHASESPIRVVALVP